MQYTCSEYLGDKHVPMALHTANPTILTYCSLGITRRKKILSDATYDEN